MTNQHDHDGSTDGDERTDGDRPASYGRPTDRRTFLAGATVASAAGLSGCLGSIFGDDDAPGSLLQGSGYAGRPEPGGTSMEDLPELEGSLDLFSGRNEFLVGRLVEYIEGLNDGLTIRPKYGDATDLVNTILNAGQGADADVFFSVNAGALGALADEGRTRSLSSDLRDVVREEFSTDDWIGTSGRVRTVPYNTDALSADDLPDDIHAYPDEVDADLGWAPSYGSCQGFVTAMRILEGDDTTREWLEAVVDAGIQEYPNEQQVCQAIVDGEIDAGFTNHYYIERVKGGNDDAPIDTAFTEGDAGATFNVAGAAVVDTASDPELAENFVRYLLSAEAQEFFAVETSEYPLIPEVEPLGDLPTIDELAVPDVDPTELSDLEATVDLMREVGITV